MLAPGEVTLLLDRVNRGDRGALDSLMPIVDNELRAMAAARVRHESGSHTQPTALVNDAYLKVFGSHHAVLENRQHFFAVFSRAMEQVLVDAARSRSRQKRGGEVKTWSLTEADDKAEARLVDALEVHDLLVALEREDQRAAEVVRMKFFGGLQDGDIATVMQLSTKTVRRDWYFARTWLLEALGGDQG